MKGILKVLSLAVKNGKKSTKVSQQILDSAKSIRIFGGNKQLQTVALGTNGRTYVHAAKKNDPDITNIVSFFLALPLIGAASQCTSGGSSGGESSTPISADNDEDKKKNTNTNIKYEPSKYPPVKPTSITPMGTLKSSELGEILTFKSKLDSIEYMKEAETFGFDYRHSIRDGEFNKRSEIRDAEFNLRQKIKTEEFNSREKIREEGLNKRDSLRNINPDHEDISKSHTNQKKLLKESYNHENKELDKSYKREKSEIDASFKLEQQLLNKCYKKEAEAKKRHCIN